MHILMRSRLVDFYEKHPESKNSLLLWYKLTANSNWQNFVELREFFPSAELVKNFTVFNIGGNKYRLITYIDYVYQKAFIRYVLTRAESDREDWKQDSWYK